mgnify:CR=1 FL=1
MVLNKSRIIHNGMGKKEDSSKPASIMHKLYYTEGEYKFGELNLIGYEGWKIIHPLIEENEIIASVKRGREGDIISSLKKENYYKTLICENKNERVMAIMYLDLYENFHELDITLRNSPDGTLEKTVSMLERELKCKWNDRKIKKETPVLDLTEK